MTLAQNLSVKYSFGRFRPDYWLDYAKLHHERKGSVEVASDDRLFDAP